jgi:lipoprotein NlpI
MSRFWAAALFWLALVSSAQAGSYEDYSNGVDAYNRGDADAAITLLSRALAVGDLAPGFQPIAYFDRGMAHRSKAEIAPAISDFDAVLKLKPDDVRTHAERAILYAYMGQFDAAILDYSAAIAVKPSAGLYVTRGRLYWANGDPVLSAADFAKSISLAPAYAYGVVWLALVRAGEGVPDDADEARAAAALNGRDWPAPAVALFRGKAQPDDVMKAASDGEPAALEEQKCEADFYVAEWQLQHRQRDLARPLLQEAISACPPGIVELLMANIELQRMDRTRK